MRATMASASHHCSALVTPSAPAATAGDPDPFLIDVVAARHARLTQAPRAERHPRAAHAYRAPRTTCQRSCNKQDSPAATRTPLTMRHRPLHAALSAFADEAACQLADATADGAEVPFEIIESRGARRDTPLYCYRPLTETFIRDRVGVLELLPSYPAAARALAALDGVGDYLREQSEPRVPVEPRERADAALRVFVSRVFSEATEFILTPDRFDRAYAELEDALLEGRAEAVVVAPLLGLRLVSAEVPLGQGLSLIRGEELPDAPRRSGLAEQRRRAVRARLPDADERSRRPRADERGDGPLPAPADRAAALRPGARRARPGRLGAHRRRARGRSAASARAGARAACSRSTSRPKTSCARSAT